MTLESIGRACATRRSSKTFAAWMVVATAFAPIGASAENLPSEGLTVPLVMLAVDTSGSMEYEDQAALVPSCPALGPFRRNRWAIALETLTGSFDAFTCSLDERLLPPTREDYAYQIPHVVYNITQQSPNGLIDLHADAVKFSLATFDTVFAIGADAAGGWSYGSSKGHPILGLVNLGIKNEDANTANGSIIQGGLRPFYDADSPSTAIRAANLAVEQALFDTIPFGGTPIAPMISDIEEYLSIDPSLAEYDAGAGTGDPFYGCRPRFTILITDGLPTQGEGVAEGYVSSAQAASNLYASHPLGVKTFVVGFALAGGVVPPELEAIAQAGDPDCADPPCAFVANNQSELVFALGEIIGQILTGTYSRSTAIYTNVTKTSADAQYQFNTGWGDVPVNSIDRVGYIDRVIYRCTEACQSETGGADLCEVQSLSQEAINENATPAPVYLIDETEFEQLAKGNTDVTADMLGIPNGGTPENPGDPIVSFLDLRPLPPYTAGTRQILGTVTLGTSDDEDDRDAYRDQVIDLVLAAPESRRNGYRMGAVRYGTPVVSSRPPSGVSLRSSYGEYQAQNKDRPTVLFVPTGMGELMAIRVDRGVGVGADDPGEHLWSVIPRHLVPKLKDHATGTQYLMDLPPVVREVLLQRATADAEPVAESQLWRTVLVQGYRAGGRGYFALDVTDPEDPELLWELDPDKRCYVTETAAGCADNTAGEEDDFCRLGFTYSRPVLGNVFINTVEFPNQERGVAVFGGGTFDESDDADESYTCGISATFNEADIGRNAFVVDLSSGQKLIEFNADKGNIPAGDAAKLLYDFVGTPACYNTGADAVMTRCFLGDAGGQMWRIDLTGGDPGGWLMTLFFDPYDAGQPLAGEPRAPVYSTPSLAFDNSTGRLAVVWGTGAEDSVLAVGATHGVFSVTERITLDSTGVADPASDVLGTLNWSKMFTGATMVTGSPVVFDSVAYFTTYAVNVDDACTIPDDAAKLWGLHYTRSTTSDPDIPGDPIAALVLDPEQPDDKVEFRLLDASLGIPTGVSLIRRPSCVNEEALSFDQTLGSLGGDGSTPGAVGGSGGGPGTMELVVQQSPGAKAGGGGGAPAPSGSVSADTVKLQSPQSTIFPLSWALVFD